MLVKIHLIGRPTITISPSVSEHENESNSLPLEWNYSIGQYSAPADTDSDNSMDVDKTFVAEDNWAPSSLKMGQGPARFRAAMRRRSCLLSPPAQR
jgi:hypothetical protein